jgi:hypothetical protein
MWRFMVATPIEQVWPRRERGSGWISPGWAQNVVLITFSRISSARSIAVSRSQSGSRMTNSSPP